MSEEHKMGCLYWIFIGWWWVPFKWTVKLFYWICIKWWIEPLWNIETINSPLEIFKKKNYNNIFVPPHLMNKLDSLFIQAGWLAINKGKLLTSDIQNSFRIGFSRAEQIVKQLEECHVIGPCQSYGSGCRKTLMTRNQFEYLLNNYHGFFLDSSHVLPNQNQIINNNTNNNNDYDNMEGHQFEHYCAELLKKNNYENVEVTQGSGDHGIDILAEKDGITYAIQCKCYSSNIGNAAVQQAYTGKGFYHKDIAVVLTNRYFTSQAKEEAQALGVKLWDRDRLNKLIENQ